MSLIGPIHLNNKGKGLFFPIAANANIPRKAMFKGKFLTLDRDPQGAALLRMDPPGDGKPFAVEDLWNEFEEALVRLDMAGRIPILMIQGSKRGFLAGWSPDWLEVHLGTPAWERANAQFRKVLSHLRDLPCPVIAVIHGPCLGEGLELALAADFRIALDQPRLQFGFLTEERGLIPEGGMLGRLVGLIGWEKSSLLAAGGSWIGGPAAKSWGILDGLSPDETSLKGLIVMTMGKALSQGKMKPAKLPLRTWRQRIWESTGLGRSMLIRGMDRLLASRSKEDAPASGEAANLLKTLPGGNGEIEKATMANRHLATCQATRFLLGFQAEFHRWQNDKTTRKTNLTGPVSLEGDGNAGINLLAIHARKGGAGLIHEKDPDTLGKITLGLKKAFPKGSSLAKLATILADPDGTKSAKAGLTIIDSTNPLVGSVHSRERLCVNFPKSPGVSSPGQSTGIIVLPERPYLALVESPEGREFANGPAWLTSLGCVVRPIKPGCELLAPMTLWIIWDEIVHLISQNLATQSIEADWMKMGMRPGPLHLLDLQGLELAKRMEKTWKTKSPNQIDVEWASPLLEHGFRGWPERKGIGMTVLGRWVPNPLAVNVIKKTWTQSTEKPDPLWTALGQSGKVREGRERTLLRLASVVAQFQEDCGLDETTVDRILVAGIGWPAHKPGPLAWAREKGWDNVVSRLEKMVSLTGSNRYRPTQRALKNSRE